MATEEDRESFHRQLAQPWSDEPLVVAELYKAPNSSLTPSSFHRAALFELVGRALYIVFRRVTGRARRDPHFVLIGVGESTAVLLRAAAPVMHDWRVVGLIGAWPIDALTVESGRYFELDVRTPDGRRFDLAPVAVTKAAGQIAARLRGL